MNTVNASIITIGDELLIGQTIDTNSAFIAQELNKIGVWVKRRVAVGDNYDDIWNALDDESQESDIIIITGGLGPTADDITKPLLCKYFGGKLVVNEEVLAHVKYLFEKVFRRPGPILESNLKQAEVPDNCVVLHNKRGTAPGMWFKAPLNPPQGGTSEPKSLKGGHSYPTADPITYSLLKEFVAEHRSNPTEAEKVLWEIVRGRKMAGFKFRRQHIINNYIADFVSIREKLIIEVDGLHHQLPENKKNDEERTKDLNRLGFEVIRFTNEKVLQKTDEVINTIVLRVKERNIELSETKVPPRGGFRGAVFVSLPGVPHEMKGLLINEVIPRLQKEFKLPAIIHKTAFTAGQGESMLADMLKDFEPTLPTNIKLAYLPNYGMVKLRLTAHGDNKTEVEKQVQPYFEKLQELVKDYLVSNEDEGLEVIIGKILKAKGKTMGTAESCTGGYIAHLITSIPGSSVYYNGSVVSYSYEAKENLLDVKNETLKNFGAVSEETVKEMLQGALRILNVDYALAVSGIMGPDGGTEEKPVGTVWIAAGNKNKTDTIKLNLRFDRQRNIEMTAAAALNFLRKFILKN
ncbi:MAG: nicotinamide-nucleotide amidohydrolase family protein [Sphingobacteriales bacterium]|nr:nicotinamide-nucleotide amidohydrolase family protein [Sphingobacteriales bacterium]